MTWRHCLRAAPIVLVVNGCAWAMDLKSLSRGCQGACDEGTMNQGGQGGAGGAAPPQSQECEVGEYYDESAGCLAVAVCADDEFEKFPASPTSNRVCQKIRECVEGERQSDPPSPTSDRKCSRCGEDFYEKGGECVPLTECTEDQYESAGPTATSDRRCEPLTICGEGDVEIDSPAWNKDRVCAPSECGDGITDPLIGEDCDDGNTESGDQCSKNCKIELDNGHECDTSEECGWGECTTFYLDVDQDGHGDGSAGSVTVCGAFLEGYVDNDDDCCDSDANAKPGQTEYFPGARKGCGGYDYDCDKEEEQQHTEVHPCVCGGSSDPGWVGGAAPDCGGSGRYGVCVFTAGSGCSGTLGSSNLVQGCH